jgi:hypothetical protein
MRQKGHFDAREPKYCERRKLQSQFQHDPEYSPDLRTDQCPCKDVDGTMCIDRKKAGETCCTTRMMPTLSL